MPIQNMLRRLREAVVFFVMPAPGRVSHESSKRPPAEDRNVLKVLLEAPIMLEAEAIAFGCPQIGIGYVELRGLLVEPGP